MYFVIFAVAFIQLVDGSIVLFDGLPDVQPLMSEFHSSCGKAADLFKTSKAAKIRRELIVKSGFKTWHNFQMKLDDSKKQENVRSQKSTDWILTTGSQDNKTSNEKGKTIYEQQIVFDFEKELQKPDWRKWLEGLDRNLKLYEIERNTASSLIQRRDVSAKLSDAAKSMFMGIPMDLTLYASVTEAQWNENEDWLAGDGIGTIRDLPSIIPLYVKQSSALNEKVKDARGFDVIFRVRVPTGTKRLLYFKGEYKSGPFFLLENGRSTAGFRTTRNNLIRKVGDPESNWERSINMVEVNLV